MKTSFKMMLALMVVAFSIHFTPTKPPRPEEKLGWKLGAQSYTFNRFSFFEAIDKIDSCGLRFVEAFPGQNIGGGLEGKMDYHMSAERRTQVLQKLKAKGITLVSYGVVSANTDADWK